MGTEGKEHKEACKKLAKHYNLEEVVVRGNSKIKYFPDLRNKDTDFEVEVLPKNITIKNKISKWDCKRKKVLVIKLWDYIFSNFDEILFINDKNEIKKLK